MYISSLADAVSAACTLKKGWAWTTATTEPVKIDLEPLSMISDLWLRVFLPDGTKPALSLTDYHITWDVPMPVSAMDFQGVKRWASSQLTDHVVIISAWKSTIRSALNLHFPIHKNDDAMMIDFFEGAAEGLKLVQEVYTTGYPKEDKSGKRIKKCIGIINKALVAAATDEGYKPKRDNLPLSTLTKDLWTKYPHLILTVHQYFTEIVAMVREDREKDDYFDKKFQAIVSITGERSHTFGDLITQRIY
jgi:hypothetical protein